MDTTVEEVRAVLKEEGIAVVTSVVDTETIERMKQSILGDFHNATVRYRMSELLSRIPNRQLHANEIRDNLAVLQQQLLPPRQRVPIDGVLNKHRIPLTTSSQLCRVAPGIRHVFSRLWGVDQEDLCQRPDATRIIFEQHVASGCSDMPLGQSPEQVMFRRLNGTWMPPHYQTAFEAYSLELKRRLGSESPMEFGVMGLLTLTGFRSGPPAVDNTVAVGPCLVAVPSCKVPMKRVYHLSEKASTKQVRQASVRRFQALTDDELDACMDDFACIQAPAGSLILYRRDVPIAFNYGDPEAANVDHDNPYKLAYTAVASSWIPRSAQLENERDRCLNLFRNKSRDTALYEMRTLTRAETEKKKRAWRMKRKTESDSSDALCDIPQEHCRSVKLQLSAL